MARHVAVIADAVEVEFAMAEGSVKTHDRIRFKNPDFGRDTIYGDKGLRVIETTAGRVLFNQIWPKDIGFFNRARARSN